MTRFPKRIHGLTFTSDPRALFLPMGLIVGVALTTGCAQVCGDDGFAWQQDPSCLAQLTITDGTDTAATATDSATDSDSMTMTSPTTTAGGGGSWCVDADKDGFGDPANCTEVPPGEQPPEGSVNNDDDCDDADGNTFPGAAPNDDPTACMKDADGDDWGDLDPPGDGGPGEPVPGTDCDDADADTFVGAAPNDDPDACMQDADGDDWGDSDPPGDGGPGEPAPGSDCDDANDGVWQSCGGCTDADGDGWLSGCDSYPPGFPTEDCDDADPDTFPGAAPHDDPDACMKDADGDDWGDSDPPGDGGPGEPVAGTDCDDADADTFPGAAEADDPNACMADNDDDGHGDANPDKPGVTPGSDCFDDNALLNPSEAILFTAPINTGEISEVDLDSGAVTPHAMVDVMGINPWIPTSVAINPVDGSIVAALAFRNRLATMNYCGGGVPTDLPMPHNKNICGLTIDRAGNIFAIDGQVDQLLVIGADGSVTAVHTLTFMGATLNVADCGMAYDCHADRLLVSDSGSGGIYSVNPADGTTERLADLPGEAFGAGLEYDPTTKAALSCVDTSILSIALDGSNQFTALTALSAPADDLAFGPACN